MSFDVVLAGRTWPGRWRSLGRASPGTLKTRPVDPPEPVKRKVEPLVNRHQAAAAGIAALAAALVLACPRCGGRLRVIATVEDPVAVREILAARRRVEALGPGPPARAGGPAMAS